MDISQNIEVRYMNFLTELENILMQGTMSQISYLGRSFYFMSKKRVTFGHFMKLDFVDFIK